MDLAAEITKLEQGQTDTEAALATLTADSVKATQEIAALKDQIAKGGATQADIDRLVALEAKQALTKQALVDASAAIEAGL